MRSVDNCVPEPNTGCLLWLGAVDWKGYGQRHWHGKTMKVHRVAWEEEFGSVPPGMSVLHLCDVRSCANTRHLYLGTQSMNVRDMYARGRSRFQIYPPVSECKAGHKFTDDNTYLTRQGRRQCKRCRADRMKQARHYGHHFAKR